MGLVVAVEGILGGAAGALEAAPVVLGLVTGEEPEETAVALEPTRGPPEAATEGPVALAAGTCAGAALGAPEPVRGGALIIPLDGPQLIANANMVSADTGAFHRARNGPDASTGSPGAKRVPTNIPPKEAIQARRCDIRL